MSGFSSYRSEEEYLVSKHPSFRVLAPKPLVVGAMLAVIALISFVSLYTAYMNYGEVVALSTSTSRLHSSVPVNNPGWQTYRNAQYGFEFKYPAGWDLRDHMNDAGQKFVEIANEPLDPLSPGCQSDCADIKISPAGTFSDADIIKYKTYGEPVSFSYDGWTGFRERTLEEPGVSSDAIGAEIVSGSGTKMEAFWLGMNLVNISAEAYFLPVLSTFKFTQ